MSGISRPEYLETKKKALAAANNEQLTRLRVERLETRQGKVENLPGRSFWGRLAWLLTGK